MGLVSILQEFLDLFLIHIRLLQSTFNASVKTGYRQIKKNNATEIDLVLFHQEQCKVITFLGPK